MGWGSGEWYVLVEAMKALDGESSWRLKEKLHVEGGREQALRRAEELSVSYTTSLPGGESRYGYQVFRISETSWLLEITKSSAFEFLGNTEFVRISVAELVASKEIPPRQGKLRRTLGRE